MFKTPFIRLFRYFKRKCIVCGRHVGGKKYRYCSIECWCYDKHKEPEMKRHPVKTLLFGHVDYYKNHFKYKEKNL